MTSTDKETHDAPDNVTLITSGFRTRLRDDGSKKIAAIGEKSGFGTQAELQAFWEKKVMGVSEDNYVDAAADLGIFSAQFGQQVTQLAKPENTHVLSMGLGLVSLGAQYPQYDLGEHEVDMPSLMKERSSFNTREWWNFVSALGGSTIADVVLKAVKKGNRVIITIPTLTYYMIRDDMDKIAKSKPEVLDEVLRHLRLIGPDLDLVVPAKLLPCVMPYDRDGLNVAVPGARSNGTRRMAYLLNHVSPTNKAGGGGTDPRKDYNALTNVLGMAADGEFEALKYEASTLVPGEGGSKLTHLSDDEAIALIKREYLTKTAPVPLRIARMMRDDGYSMNQERASELLDSIQEAASEKKSSKGDKSSGSGSGSKSKPKSKSEKVDKPKRAKTEKSEDADLEAASPNV